MSERPASPGEPIARKAAALAADLKATDIVVLDLRGVTDMTDYFVIASGTSDTPTASGGRASAASITSTGR